MKPIYQMILGAITAGLSAMIAIPQYCDCASRVHTSNMLSTISSIKHEMRENLETTGSIRGVGSALKEKIQFVRPPEFFEISPEGVFIVRGGDDGQLLVLLPRVIDKQIEWTCIGGSRDAMPWDCDGNRVDIGSARNVEINGVVPRPAP
jgi:hypothetical protein